MSIPEGPPDDSSSTSQVEKWRFKFHSDDNKPGKQSVLNSLVTIWNEGLTAPGGSIPILSATACRWQTLNLLRLFVFKREHTAGVALSMTEPENLPMLFRRFWHFPRLTTVGVEIGSQTIHDKTKHIDIDWFGPSGSGAQSNWWHPSIDGAQAELDTAKWLIKFLEKALGIDAGGTAPERWTWPGGRTPSIPLEALDSFDPVFEGAFRHSRLVPPPPLRLEWWVRDRRWNGEPMPDAFNFRFDNLDNPTTLFIETPDANGPDPN